MSADSAPAFADLDSDGDTDLLLGGKDGTLTYYENAGSGQVQRCFGSIEGLGNV